MAWYQGLASSGNYIPLPDGTPAAPDLRLVDQGGRGKRINSALSELLQPRLLLF